MKKTFILLTAALITGSIAAQDLEQRRHELSIHAGAGLSTLQYDLSEGKHKSGIGTQAGLGYTLFLSPNWGLTTGAEFALYRSKSNLSNFIDTHDVTGATPADNHTCTFALDQYSEAQQALYINIPLMLQYQTGGTNKFYAALGAKIGFPISATAKTDDYTVTTSGYYPAEGRTYDDLPQYGFGTYNYQGSTTDVAFRISAMASAEMGAKWKISNKNALYTGIYIDYGFTNIQKTKDKPFVQSALTADNPPMSPLVESQHAGTSFTGNITPLAVGLKLRFAFGCGKDFQNPVRRPVETRHATSPQQQPPPVDNSAVEAQAAAEAEAQAQATRQREAAQAEARRLEQEKAAARQTAKNTIQKPVENYKMSQTTLTTAQKAALDEKVELLQQNPDIEVFIYGHTCNIGGDKINDKIGLQRAQNAKAYLISKGITPNRITGAASKRDTEPLIPNTTEENRTKNRRIEIIVQQ